MNNERPQTLEINWFDKIKERAVSLIRFIDKDLEVSIEDDRRIENKNKLNKDKYVYFRNNKLGIEWGLKITEEDSTDDNFLNNELGPIVTQQYIKELKNKINKEN